MFLSIVLILFTYCSDNGVNPPEIPSDIPSDESPSWSPDGKWIDYWHYNPNLEDSTYKTGLYIIDVIMKVLSNWPGGVLVLLLQTGHQQAIILFMKAQLIR